jgi:hypothetical protein
MSYKRPGSKLLSKIAPGSTHDHVSFSRCKSYRSYLENGQPDIEDFKAGSMDESLAYLQNRGAFEACALLRISIKWNQEKPSPEIGSDRFPAWLVIKTKFHKGRDLHIPVLALRKSIPSFQAVLSFWFRLLQLRTSPPWAKASTIIIGQHYS